MASFSYLHFFDVTQVLLLYLFEVHSQRDRNLFSVFVGVEGNREFLVRHFRRSVNLETNVDAAGRRSRVLV